jgi:F-type H+-transporting ATPase subunit gamma
MTHRRDLEQHRQSLGEIRNIINSMKTLAYMETRKLERVLVSQRNVVCSIEEAAADFLSFYPDTLPESKETAAVYLLIGTERGFCGDFNHALLKKLNEARSPDTHGEPTVISTGHKLRVLLEDDKRVAAALNGACVVEEVTTVLGELVDELTRLHISQKAINVFCIYHDGDNDITVKRLLPPFEGFAQKPQQYSHPPQLNMTPQDFLTELSEQYLFAVLHEILYTSLIAENYKRITHLEGAVKHMDEESEKLARQCNALRQEEIIEEIEVILLSASDLFASAQK